MKQAITVVLLLFVVASVVYLAAGENQVKPGESQPAVTTASAAASPEVVVYYFHGTMRCKKCLAMEAYARDAVETRLADKVRSDAIGWRTANFDLPENKHFVKDFALTASAVVVIRYADGMPVQWKKLDRIWDLVQDEGAFKDYIVTEALAMMESRS